MKYSLTWKFKLFHWSAGTKVVFIFIVFTKNTTYLVMLNFPFMIMFLAAMRGVTTIRAFEFRGAHGGTVTMVFLIAYRTCTVLFDDSGSVTNFRYR